MKEILKELSKNHFDPKSDDPQTIPKETGIYCITANSVAQLPTQMRSLTYSYLNNRPVIYVGISNKSLRTRDYSSHFKGNARGSTLRKSLGSLLGLERIQSQNDMGKSRYKFTKSDEMRLSNWMVENIQLHFYTHPEPDLIEQELINFFKPPLNLKDNKNKENIDFRSYLITLRRF
ncbi:GIY-YIG nuclease family protein [Cohnella panacarvi]|uniref:GIY-YIG nuclease family protein n=1 Tax=Cohnella panacarvi TaxID=400776 RepID=UPI0012EC98C4|nr:hypothetical protein [Cohnella panacarvi]